jgi:hypothetical protein
MPVEAGGGEAPGLPLSEAAWFLPHNGAFTYANIFGSNWLQRKTANSVAAGVCVRLTY